MRSDHLPEPVDSRKEYEVNVYRVGDLEPLLSTQSQSIGIMKEDCFTHLSVNFSDAICGYHSIGYEKIDHISFLKNQVDIYLI